ncbi:MAG: pilus assembly PilX N-terminal domain-containing protein [Cellvibrionaceae bacterium]
MKTPMSSQNGAVLAIALMLLLVITIVGLSSIGSTALEEKMAANAQFKQVIFQTSEDAIEQTIDDLTFLNDALTANILEEENPVKDVVPSGRSETDTSVTASSEASFRQYSSVPAGEGASSATVGGAGLGYYFYEVKGAAKLVNVGTKNTNVRGLYLPGPKWDVGID